MSVFETLRIFSGDSLAYYMIKIPIYLCNPVMTGRFDVVVVVYAFVPTCPIVPHTAALPPYI